MDDGSRVAQKGQLARRRFQVAIAEWDRALFLSEPGIEERGAVRVMAWHPAFGRRQRARGEDFQPFRQQVPYHVEPPG